MCKWLKNIFRKKKPYRTDYKPQLPKELSREDVTMEHLINTHRASIGKRLLKSDALTYRIAKEHCIYMVNEGKPSHDGYPQRLQELRMNNFTKIGECTAYGFSGAKGFLKGYLNSESHRKVIEGDYTHIGTSTIKHKRNYNVTILTKYENNK